MLSAIALLNECDRVVEILCLTPCSFDRFDPIVKLHFGRVERACDISNRAVVAEEESARVELFHTLERIQSECKVEIWRRSRRPDLSGLGDVHAGGVTRVKISGEGINETHVMRGVTRIVECREGSPVSEIDESGIPEDGDAFNGSRKEIAEQPVHRLPEHPVGACDKFRRICEVPGALFVDGYLRPRKQVCKVADATSMIEVDVGYHDRGKILWADAQSGQLSHDDRGRTGRSSLDEAGLASPDQVACGDSLIATHSGIDHEHVVPEVCHV